MGRGGMAAAAALYLARDKPLYLHTHAHRGTIECHGVPNKHAIRPVTRMVGTEGEGLSARVSAFPAALPAVSRKVGLSWRAWTGAYERMAKSFRH
jgi:hypothetical protein